MNTIDTQKSSNYQPQITIEYQSVELTLGGSYRVKEADGKTVLLNDLVQRELSRYNKQSLSLGERAKGLETVAELTKLQKAGDELYETKSRTSLCIIIANLFRQICAYFSLHFSSEPTRTSAENLERLKEKLLTFDENAFEKTFDESIDEDPNTHPYATASFEKDGKRFYIANEDRLLDRAHAEPLKRKAARKK